MVSREYEIPRFKLVCSFVGVAVAYIIVMMMGLVMKQKKKGNDFNKLC